MVPYDLYAAALCLDGPTLANLELLEGSSGEAEGSLLAAMDTCASPGTKLPYQLHVTHKLMCNDNASLDGLWGAVHSVKHTKDRLDAFDEISKRKCH